MCRYQRSLVHFNVFLFSYRSRVRLIASVPGRHSGADKDKWGHLRLQKVWTFCALCVGIVELDLHLSQQFLNQKEQPSDLTYNYSNCL